MLWRNITLELSLKPFTDATEETARRVCRELFLQWRPILKHADGVSVMLWCSDGSEILDYRGNLEDAFEWARYIGGANPRQKIPTDPEGIGLHSRPHLYREEPAVFTYAWLKRLVAVLKEEGQAVCGRPVRVGETFDPGPEFAKSSFKYERHNEICLSNTMGRASFVCCYATLNADGVAYAGFPDGIPQDMPFGTFLGRQCRHFLTDLGFDYVWLSNGFGFGLETWGLRGMVFDGARFYAERVDDIRRRNLEFWDRFRAECPGIPIETRGTNLSTGMDLSSDAVPLREIYRGGYGIEPPPNSPWAALNGDFGVELIGWMSHIAEIPGESFPFRFYTHDPWWLNSPWLDRYEREPHDIYLPLSVARIDETGAVHTPTGVEFLTADNSFGEMPDQVPNEVIPHVLSAKRDEPDAPSPLVWVYPFDEYHEWTFGAEPRLDEVFFGDWFLRGAVNQGLPLNTVVSTASLRAAQQAAPARFDESVLVSPVPQADSPWEDALLAHRDRGGHVLLYGPIERAGRRMLAALNLQPAEPLTGTFEIAVDAVEDIVSGGNEARRIAHHPVLSAGGIDAVLADASDPDTQTLAVLRQGDAARVGAVARRAAGKGTLAWVRGTVSCDPERTGGHLLLPLDAREFFPAERLMRHALCAFGYEMASEKRDAAQPGPMLAVARHTNGFFFSGYSPDTTVRQHLRFPQGAPLLTGWETYLENGRSTYTPPRAWHRECRVFVEQAEDGLLACREKTTEMIGVSRRLLLTGLKNATVRFYDEPGREEGVRMLREPRAPYVIGDFVTPERREDECGRYLAVEGITGSLLISW